MFKKFLTCLFVLWSCSLAFADPAPIPVTEGGEGTTYTASGMLLSLDGTEFFVEEGTLTNGKGCRYLTISGLNCDQDYLTSFTETDPIAKAVNGLLKSNGSLLSAAIAGTDYVATESDPVVKAINGLVKSNGSAISAASAGTDYLAPFTNSAGLMGALSDEVGTGFAVFNASPNFTGRVGIGTTLGSDPGLVVMGNVGIGTWIPGGPLQVNNNTTQPLLIDVNGNVGVGTTLCGTGLCVMNGNVGIGTWSNRGVNLYVNGTFTVNSTTNTGSLTAGGNISAGANTVAGTKFIDNNNTAWQVDPLGSIFSGINMSAALNANVGIGTLVANSSLSVRGNVGIGTTLASGYLQPGGANDGGMRIEGNVGIGTWVVSNKLQVGSNATAIGQLVCFGTNNCIGYCSLAVAATGACSTCTCLTN